MPDDRVASTLAGQDPAVILEYIREGAESEITHPDDECGVKAGGSCTAHGALLTVAALEAVLKLAGDSTVMTHGHAPGRQGPIAWTLDPADVREAITTALTGKEAGDGR